MKPSPPIFIFETGEGQPPLFQISGECEFSARVCHSESPKLFYIQMKAYSQTIASLTNEITNSMVDAAATGMKHQLSSCNPRRISRSSIPCIGITFSSEWQNYFRAYLRRNLAGNRVRFPFFHSFIFFALIELVWSTASSSKKNFCKISADFAAHCEIEVIVQSENFFV